MTAYPPASAPQKRKKPLLKWLVIAVVIGGAIHYVPKLLGHKAGAQDPMAAMMAGGMPASVATVIAKPVTAWSEFSGLIEAVNSAEVRPRVSGQIAAVHFKDGSAVQRGQLLFTIDTRPYEAELQRARGAVIAAEAAQKNAAQEFSRAQALIKSKSISKAEFERAQSALSQANGALGVAKGAARGAEVNLAYANVAAPISGTISRAELTVGNNVEAGPNAPVMASIVDLSPIYASFEIDERTYLQALQGAPKAKRNAIPVEVQPAAGNAIPAKIHAFDNQITAGSGTIRVRAILENKDGMLVPGMFAKVRIGSPEQTSSILINPVAVGTDQNKKFVYVVNAEGKAEYREVTTGQIVEGLQIIKAGLNEGEQIVVGGLQRLRPGAPVKAIPTDMETLKSLEQPAVEAEAGAGDAASAEAKEAAPAESK